MKQFSIFKQRTHGEAQDNLQTALVRRSAKLLSVILAVTLAFAGCKKDDMPIRVTAVSLDKETLSIPEGGTETLKATIVPEDAENKEVTWKSSATQVATVDATGKVTAVKAGATTITVTSVDGEKTAICTVTVTAVVSGVKLNKETLALTEGGTETLIASIAPDNAANKAVTWKSSDETIATVDATGKVTAVKEGEATITVTTTDGGKTATCVVTVAPLQLAPTLTTLEATHVGSTGAWLGGNISSVGTPSYTVRGVCYATTQSPTTDNTKITIEGTGTGDFSNSVTGLNSETKYYARAYAVHATGTVYGNEISFTTTKAVPEAPSHLTATASGTQIYLDWDSASGAEGYQVERSLNGTTGWTVLDDKLTKTDYINVGLTADTRYYYRVRAYNDAGNSPYSNTVNVTTDKPALAAPAGLRATPISSTEINLAWTAVSGADGYSIERSTNGTSGWTEIAANIVTDSYRDKSLTVVGTYYYRIRAFRGNAYSEYSSVASTTTAVTVPATPTGLKVIAFGSTELTLSWTAVSGATYSIERRVSGGGSFTVIASEIPTDSYRDTGLSSSAEYYYRIRAHNGAGYSEYSAEVTGRTGGYSLTALNNRITWDESTKRYTLTNSSSNPGLYFKFGSVVGNMSTPTTWNLNQNVLWSPVAITTWASIPFYVAGDYSKTVTRESGYHTIDNVKAGKGDPCRLVGLDLDKIKNTSAGSLTYVDIDNGVWRLPTQTENEEFSGYIENTNTTAHWTTAEIINGGMFPNTSSGSNKFLPASGYRDEAGARQMWTEEGYYWANAPKDENNINGLVLNFTANKVWLHTMSMSGLAASVRCVRQQ